MTARITLSIEGMECPNCAMKLEAIEDRLPGVRRAEASYQRGELTVEFDETQVSEHEIHAAVERIGYQVSGKK